jgi:hypothetical protein
VTFTADDPEAAQVGEEVTFEVVLEDPFEDPLPDEWTLAGETDLEEPDWTMTSRDVADEEIQQTEDGTITVSRTGDQDVNSVTIIVTGTVPDDLDADDYSYEDPSSEEYLVLELFEQRSADDRRTLEGGSWTAHHFTEASQNARQVIDDASEAGASDNDLSQAISAYDEGNFELAQELANDVKSDTESEDQTQQLLLFGGGAVVVLVLLGGGYYLYQQRQQNTNKLQ